jgi:hypothetical protein
MKGQKIIIEIGATFGRLTVLEHLPANSHGDRLYRCRCACNRETKPSATSLRRGLATMCGHCHRTDYVRPDSAIKRMYRTYRRGAINRLLKFGLTFEEFTALIKKKPCHYCGSPPVVNSYSENSKVAQAVNGIDRIDSSLDYVPSNTVPCCKICNNAKRDMLLCDFLSWLKKAALHSLAEIR